MSKRASNSLYRNVPEKPGHKIVGGAWRWDAGRKRYVVTQVLYEPIEAADPPEPKSDRRQSLLL